MLFYLLISTVVFTTIFGFIRSQTARENLHLQSFYEWFVKIMKNGLFSNQTNSNVHGIINISDVLTNQTDRKNLKKTQSLDSIEAFRGIKVEDEDSIGSSNSLNKDYKKYSEDHEKIFDVINASLKKLSSSANSVKMNGNQLYNLLLQEMFIHHKVSLNQNNHEAVNVQGPSSEAIIEVKEVESQVNTDNQKPKMYFGESPLEYVSHQK